VNSSTTLAASGVRLDKWLWAARFFKTRSLAADEIGRHRVEVNGQVAKASREVRPGDLLSFRQGPDLRTVRVLTSQPVRGPATMAQQMYEETPDSIAAREALAQRHRLAPEPASALEQGRPTKRDRRRLAEWDRWSATLEPERR
jgi:ribosome-associated heat shock protein Hsp15